MSGYVSLAALGQTAISPASFAPAGHAMGTLAPLSTYFATLAEAQAQFPTAVALTDQTDGECVIAALAAGAADPGGAVLITTAVYLSRPIVYDGSQVTMRGPDTFVAKFYCQLVPSGSPCITLENLPNASLALANVTLYAWNDGQHNMPGNTYGVAYDNSPAGSIGLKLTGASPSLATNFARISCVGIVNFDQGLLFATNVYGVTFENCVIAHGNIGISMPSALDNFGEKIIFRSCLIANNNWWTYITALNDAVSYAFEIVMDGSSIDYNVCGGYYSANSPTLGYNDCQNTIILTGGTHCETQGSISGNNPFITCYGGQVVINGATQFYLNGQDGFFMPGFVQFYNTAYCAGWATDVVGMEVTPLFYTTEAGIPAHGQNCYNEDGSPMIVSRCGAGDFYSPISEPFTIDGEDFVSASGSNQNGKFLCYGGSNELILNITNCPIANPGTMTCQSVTGAIPGMKFYGNAPFYNAGTITSVDTIHNTMTMSVPVAKALPPPGDPYSTIGFLGGTISTYGSGTPTDPFQMYIAPAAGDNRSQPVNFLLGTTMEFSVWGNYWTFTTAESMPGIVTASPIYPSGTMTGTLDITAATGAQMCQGIAMPATSYYPATYVAGSLPQPSGNYNIILTNPITSTIPPGTTLACGGPALELVPAGAANLYGPNDRFTITKLDVNQWQIVLDTLSPFATPIGETYTVNGGVIGPQDIVSYCNLPPGTVTNVLYMPAELDYFPPKDGWRRTIANASSQQLDVVTTLWGTIGNTITIEPYSSQEVLFIQGETTWITI